MVILSVFLRVPPDQVEVLRPHMKAAIAASRAEPGCVFYTLAEDMAEPGLIRAFEVYRDDAALKALGMTVLATKRNLKDTTDHEGYTEPGTGDPEGTIPARLYPPEALASMVPLCDWLVVTTVEVAERILISFGWRRCSCAVRASRPSTPTRAHCRSATGRSSTRRPS